MFPEVFRIVSAVLRFESWANWSQILDGRSRFAVFLGAGGLAPQPAVWNRRSL